jgi:signal transduction histidine kinase
MSRLRPSFTWLAFALCLAAVGGAMVWMSVTMLRQERVEFENDQLARQSENERLALWRMESALVPLIAQESSRPEYAFRSFYSLEVFSKWFTKVDRGEIQFPSELLTNDSPHVLLHFQIGPDGKVTSPQVPTGNMRDVAETNYTTHEKIKAAERRLIDVSTVLNRKRLLRMLSIRETPTAPPPEQTAAVQQNAALAQQAAGPQAPNAPAQAYARNTAEFQKRAQTSSQLLQDVGRQMFGKGTRIKPMKAVWLDDHLVLAREARNNGALLVQGCVLNWTEIRRWLTGEAADLLPECRLVPVTAGERRDQQDMLATIPVRLESGPVQAASMPVFTPMRLSLGIAWLSFLLAAAAVAWLLLAAIRLSERRGAFVSAVTHELRTPLTTFRMYTEMLSRGMIAPDRQLEYLDTLHKEADRLGHLVENVLSYARLESPKKRPACEEFPLDSVLDRLRESLSRRAAEAGMQLEWIRSQGFENSLGTAPSVRGDSAAVERIVVNLVDNACKYARHAEDRRVHVDVHANGSYAVVCVRDHGPGVSADVEQRMFLPFSKSDREAANTAPGVGLGLSLSRGLSRSMGGDLKLVRPDDGGACFELSLPLCRS